MFPFFLLLHESQQRDVSLAKQGYKYTLSCLGAMKLKTKGNSLPLWACVSPLTKDAAGMMS